MSRAAKSKGKGKPKTDTEHNVYRPQKSKGITAGRARPSGDAEIADLSEVCLKSSH